MTDKTWLNLTVYVNLRTITPSQRNPMNYQWSEGDGVWCTMSSYQAVRPILDTTQHNSLPRWCEASTWTALTLKTVLHLTHPKQHWLHRMHNSVQIAWWSRACGLHNLMTCPAPSYTLEGGGGTLLASSPVAEMYSLLLNMPLSKQLLCMFILFCPTFWQLQRNI